MEYTTRTIKVNNCTIIIRRPILTDAERQKAEQRVRDALKVYGGK